MIPFLSFDYQDSLYRNELIDAMTTVLDSKWYIMGKRLIAFEKEYAAAHSMNYSVGVANGLDALIIALHTLQVGAGDEVIVPSNTYIASWLAVSAVGAKPVPVEPDMQTYNIDPQLIGAAITSKTKVIMPVHLYGQACNMDAIMAIAKKHKLYVVEDNAQAHLSTWNRKLTGSFGDINATSFYPGKNLGALGDGGGLTTDHEHLYKAAMIYRNYGSEKKYFNEIKGVNSRLDELQAAILSVKLPYLQKLTAERQAIAKMYDEQLSDTEQVTRPFVSPEAEHSYHLYVIQCEQRDALQSYLAENNIGTLIHYPVPPHRQKAYAELGYTKNDFPLAEKLAGNCLSLPLYPGLTQTQVEMVCNTIKNFFKK